MSARAVTPLYEDGNGGGVYLFDFFLLFPFWLRCFREAFALLRAALVCARRE